MPAPQESESQGAREESRESGASTGSGDQPQPKSQLDAPRQPEAPRIWLPFGLFVLGFAILAVESKFTLPAVADYALKGLGGGLCLFTVVWIRRQARKLGVAKRPNRNNKKTPQNE